MRRPDKRTGDVLGLGNAGGSVSNREPGAAGVASSEADASKRRRRMSEGADELTPEAGDMHQGGGGATGIDMGAGGEGTDIE
jgi:hypothetical protein